MDEQTNLGFTLQARILPQIEGAEELKQVAENLSQTIQQRMQQTVESPAFQEGLKPEDIQKVQRFSSMTDMLEVQKFQERQKGILEELDLDLSVGKLTSAQRKKHLKKIGRQRQELEGLQVSLLTQVDEGYFDFLGQEKKNIFKTSIVEGTQEAITQVDDLGKKFEVMADSIGKAQDNAKGLYENLKSVGVFTLASTLTNMGIDYATRTAEIKAREKTSFDFSSPLGMYSARQRYELYKTTTERSRDYELYGGLSGMAIGAMAGIPLGPVGIIGGAVGGALFGDSLGGKLANIENIGDRAKIEEELNFLNQSWGILSNYVQNARTYDILRARARARIGRGATGNSGLGYTPEQELQTRTSFTDAFGRFDEDLYEQQTTFARAKGISPEELYRLNFTARMTGMDVGILGLSEADRIAQRTYGTGYGSQRIVDILNDIKNLNGQMLKASLDADTRDALALTRLPEVLFGVESPYGRMGELGGTSIRMFEELMKPKSMAQEAFLYSALGTPNIMDFSETMKGGIYSGDSLMKILERVKDFAGDSKMLSYFMLNEMMPNAPQGFIPRITDLLSGEGKEIDRYKIAGIDEEGKIKYAMDENDNRIKETIAGYTLSDFESELDEYSGQIDKLKLTVQEEDSVRKEISQTLTGYAGKADDAISQSERMLRELHIKINESADLWKSTIYDASTQMADFWKTQARDKEMLEVFQHKLTHGFEDFESIIDRIKNDLGIASLPEGFLNLPNSDPNPFVENRVPDPDVLKPVNINPWGESVSNDSLSSRQNLFKLEHSESFNNYMKEIDYERFEDVLTRVISKRPQEITVIIRDETNNGIDSVVENANSDFGL